MIQQPMDVLRQYPVRKSKKQKQQFRQDVMQYIQSLGYCCKEEEGSFGATNVVFGNQEGAKYLVTAHYDTCAGMPFPNFITPCNLWIYLLYQLFLVAGMVAVAGLVYGLAFALTQSGHYAYYISNFSLLGMCFLLMFGPANKSNANDNTSGVVTVLELARSLRSEYREKVCFVLFDLEEAGLIGSSAYQSAHKKITKNQLVLNLDCVGDGDEIVFFPGGKVKKNKQMMQNLASVDKNCGKKQIYLRRKGFAFYPSDQANFPYGVGIAALRRNKHVGLYMDKIHTKKDTILEEENVTLLRDALTSVIAGEGQQ